MLLKQLFAVKVEVSEASEQEPFHAQRTFYPSVSALTYVHDAEPVIALQAGAAQAELAYLHP